MADSTLRRARKARKFTQVGLAEQVGVNQATLARWESGRSAIPEEKASLLSAILGVPIGIAKSRTAVKPSNASLDTQERESQDDRHYFGEVAIHFRSGGRPLMVSIDEAARSSIYVQFDQRSISSITFETLDNRTVFVRKASISDLHLSSDAVDTFGPEHIRYGVGVSGIASTDERGFADPSGDDDLDPVDALAGHPTRQSSEFWMAIGQGSCDEDTTEEICVAVEKALASEQAQTYGLLSSYMFWQVEKSERRGMLCGDAPELSDSLLVLELGGAAEDDMLDLRCGSAGGYHHSVLLNFSSLEYLTVPTHMLEASNRSAAARDGLVDPK